MGGFFSQLGALYQVHHIWAYNDLQHRKTERERMWEDPGWDDCVAATGKKQRYPYIPNARFLYALKHKKNHKVF